MNHETVAIWTWTALTKLSPFCHSVQQEQLDLYLLNLHRIDKDVRRCDRSYWYFTPANLEKLRNIMCSYVWQHLEIGYVQGMCDLLAPLLVVLDDGQSAWRIALLELHYSQTWVKIRLIICCWCVSQRSWLSAASLSWWRGWIRTSPMEGPWTHTLPTCAPSSRYHTRACTHTITHAHYYKYSDITL